MKSNNTSPLAPCFRIPRFALPACVCIGLITASVHAATIPQNLGYGLDKLVESHLTLKAQNEAALKAGQQPQAGGEYNGYTTEAAASYAAMAITEPNTGRLLVDITLRGDVPIERVQRSIERRFPGFTVSAIDPAYRGVG